MLSPLTPQDNISMKASQIQVVLSIEQRADIALYSFLHNLGTSPMNCSEPPTPNLSHVTLQHMFGGQETGNVGSIQLPNPVLMQLPIPSNNIRA